MVTLPVLMVNAPPLGMASRALTTRFMMTCSIWAGSALTLAMWGAEHADQLHVLANQSPQHFFQIDDDVVQVKDLGFEDLFATEGEELPGECRRAVSGFLNLFAIDADRVAGADPPQDQLRVAEDGGQDVVEVVGHATGQTPTASTFWAWRNCCSRRCRSVMSSITP